MRSVLRWLRRLVVGGLALTAIVIAAGLVTAHTSWGREQLRLRIERALRDAFPGGARVAAVDGSVLGTLTLRGVELDALDHRPLITAGSVDAAVALAPLAFHTVRFDRAVADDVHVFVRDAAAAAPAPSAAPGQPSPWRVELPAVAVHRAVVDVARASLALGDLDVAGAATIAGGQIALAGVVRGRWSRGGQPAVPLAAWGDVVLDGGVRVTQAVVGVGGATLVASRLGVDPDHPEGWLAVAAPAAAVSALAPELAAAASPVALVGPGHLAVSVELVPDGAATRAVVIAAAGAARVWASLRGEPARRAARGLVFASAVDLAAVTRDRVGGRGSLAAAVDLGPDRARGVAFAQAELAAPALPVRRAAALVFGSMDDLRVLAAGRGDDDLQLAAFAGGRRDRDGFVFERGRAVASARGLVLPGARITGELAVDARLADRYVVAAASPPIGSPPAASRVVGVVTGRDVRVVPAEPGAGVAIGALRSPFTVSLAGGERGPEIAVAVRDASADDVGYNDLHAAAVRASLAAAVTPELQIATAELAGTGVRRADTQLGDARLALARRGSDYRIDATVRPPSSGLALSTEALLRPAANGLVASLGVTRVELPGGAAWTSLGGTLAIPAAATSPIQLRGLALRHGDAAIAVSSDYLRGTAGLAARIDARIEAERVDLATLGLGPVPAEGPTGVARATIDVSRRGGRWRADAAVDVTGFSVRRGATLLDATAHLVLDQRVALDARIAGPALGDLAFSVDAAAPGDPLDPLAWRRLDRDTVRRAELTVHHLALPALAGIAGALAPALTGTIDGTLDLAPGALRGELAVRGVALPIGALDASVRFAPLDGELDAHGTATLSGVASAQAALRLALPQHPFDPATWQRRGRDLVRDGSLRLDEAAFDPALLARLGVTVGGAPLPVRGRVRAELARGAAPGEVALVADLIDVTGGPLVAPLSQHIELTADATATRLHTALHAGGEADAGAAAISLGALDGTVRMPLDRWLDEPLAVLGAPLSAHWQLAQTPVAPLLALFGRRELIAGSIAGGAELRGTVAAPMIPSLTASVRDARVAPRLGGRPVPELTALDLSGSWDGANAAVTVTGREATGAELRLTLGSRSALAELTGTARLTRLDVAPIAAFLPGALGSATGIVDGELSLTRGSQVTGKLHVTGGAVPLASAIGTLRDATAELSSDGRQVTATVDGKLGRGTIHVAAHASADDLAAVTADVQLRDVSPITTLRPILTADIKAALHRDGDQLRGSVRVENGSVTLPEHSGPALLAVDVPADISYPGSASGAAAAPPAAARGPHAPAHPWLVVEVDPGAVRVDARRLGNGIGVLGTLRSRRLDVALGDSVGVRGTLEVESADVDLFGRRYVVAPSTIVFDGTTDPRLDLHMSYSFPDLTLQVAVLGRASRRELQFSSDVSLYSTDTLFAFFLGGDPASDVNNPNRDQARAAVFGATTRIVSGQIAQQLNKLSPVQIDAASCEPDTAAIGATSGSCTIGKWLFDWAYIAYRRHNQASPSENTGETQVQVRLGNKLLIEGTVGEQGHHGVDLLWRQRW